MALIVLPLILAVSAPLNGSGGSGQNSSETVQSLAIEGPNPCCTWEASGNCTVEDAVNTKKNTPATNGTPGTGAYSTDCISYIQACTNGSVTGIPSWMLGTSNDVATVVGGQSNWLPSGASLSDIEKAAGSILQIFQSLIENDPNYVKSMGAGTAENTYLAIYNCDSAFEKEHVTGCDGKGGSLFDLKPYFYGTVTDTTTYQFNFYLKDFTQPSPNHVPHKQFVPTERSWYQLCENQQCDEPAFTSVYQNFETDHPVFGYATSYQDPDQVQGVAVALQYIGDEPSYLSFNPACNGSD